MWPALGAGTRTVGAALLASLAACSGSSTTSPSQLCVVRHSEAYKNLDPVPEVSAERLDSLTPAGERQALALADLLPSPVGVVWTSPLGRTRQTAERLGAAPPVAKPALRPLDGDVDWEERVAAWDRGVDPRPDGGESLADAQARVDALLAELPAALEPGEHAVLVTHGDIASLILGARRGTALLSRPTADLLDAEKVACAPVAGAAE